MSDALAKAREAAQAKRDAGIKAEQLNPIDRAIASPNSMAAAIKAACYGCMGRGDDSGTRKEIAVCSSYACPLWPARPYQKQAPDGFGIEARQAAVKDFQPNNPAGKAVLDSDSRRKPINAYCYDCMGGDPENRTNTAYELIATCQSTFPQEENNGHKGCPLWPHRPISKKYAVQKAETSK